LIKADRKTSKGRVTKNSLDATLAVNATVVLSKMPSNVTAATCAGYAWSNGTDLVGGDLNLAQGSSR
jgi:hypothetical protein